MTDTDSATADVATAATADANSTQAVTPTSCSVSVTTPSVLFVCVKNGGKSPMAAALMVTRAGDSITVTSAGTKPGAAVNGLSAQSLREVGVDISHHVPQALTDEMVLSADVVVTLGREAHVAEVTGPQFENWDTDEPSERGIDGIERMRLVRDDIDRRVDDLYQRLTPPH